MQYSKYLYEALKTWYYGPQPTPKGPIETLRELLQQQQHKYTEKLLALDIEFNKDKQQNQKTQQKQRQTKPAQFYFNTKHTNPSIIIQRICMMYADLITHQQFQNFQPITITDLIPIINSSIYRKNQQNLTKLKQCIGLKGQLKINSDQIKCSMSIIIAIHQDIQNVKPWVYFINGDHYKMQVNPKYRNKYYEQVLGGILFINNHDNNNNKQKNVKNVDWHKYKQQNLSLLIKTIQQTIYSYFPYVKRYIKQEQQQQLLQKIKSSNLISKMPSQVITVLENIQQLVIIKNSILTETSLLTQYNQIIKKQTQKKQLENKGENQRELIIEKMMMDIQDSGKQIVDITTQIRAYDDCLGYLEKQFEKNNDFGGIIGSYKEICEQIFERKFLLQKIIHSKIELN